MRFGALRCPVALSEVRLKSIFRQLGDLNCSAQLTVTSGQKQPTDHWLLATAVEARSFACPTTYHISVA